MTIGHDERLKTDLGLLVMKIQEYGCSAEEVRDYVAETSRNYQNTDQRKEYFELAATIVYLFEKNPDVI